MRSAERAASDWRATTSVTSSARSTRRCARTGSRPSGGTSYPTRSPVAFRERSSIRTTRCSSPARLVRRLASLAADAGVEIREHDRVEDLDALEAETIVVATDGYPSGLLGALEGLIIPTRGQMIATEPLPEQLFPLPHYGRHGLDYWHQNEEGRLIAGGFRDVDMESEFTTSEETTPRIQSALEDFVEQILGRRPAVTHRWAGVFGLVPDLMPVVGRVPGRDGLWTAGGYSGHGNVLGPDVRRSRREGDPRRSASAAPHDGPCAARRLALDGSQTWSDCEAVSKKGCGGRAAGPRGLR